MKYRILSLVLAVLLLISSASYAESIFSLLPVSELEQVPSYGVIMGVEPSSEMTLEDGSTKQMYNSVTGENYLSFGVALGAKGYAVENQAVADGVVTSDVRKEDVVIEVSYDQAREEMTVIYPAGLIIQQPEVPDPFEGYVQLKKGEEVSLGKLGSLTLDGFASHSKNDLRVTSVEMWDLYERKMTDLKEYCEFCFFGTYDNITQGEVELRDIIVSATLHYINEDNHYSYDLYRFGEWRHNSYDVGYIYLRNNDRNGYKYASVDSLETIEFAGGFDSGEVPERVRDANDGIVAITFKFANNDSRYVYYLRDGEQG
ncbi:MAG: hypothetical protein IJ466_05410 [Clostridia bacterium]|nr:hypothetical protein [Clostridia bacterium]